MKTNKLGRMIIYIIMQTMTEDVVSVAKTVMEIAISVLNSKASSASIIRRTK
jgi:hypothetical protein